MDENKEEKSTPEDAGEGSKPEVYKPIDDANLAAKRLEDANKEKKELLDREEDLAAKKALGGRSEAGQEATKPKEETPKEYNDRVEKEISDGKHDE